MLFFCCLQACRNIVFFLYSESVLTFGLLSNIIFDVFLFNNCLRYTVKKISDPPTRDVTFQTLIGQE
jgi:hypothetical protein